MDIGLKPSFIGLRKSVIKLYKYNQLDFFIG